MSFMSDPGLAHIYTSWRPWLRSAAAAGIVLLFLRLAGWGVSASEVLVDLRSNAGSGGEIFYADEGQGHSSDRRIAFDINADGRWHTYSVSIPKGRRVSRVRIDPGTAAGVVEIRQITLKSEGASTTLSSKALHSALVGTNAMRLDKESPILRFVADGGDPYADFSLSSHAQSRSGIRDIGVWVGVAAVSAILWLVLAEISVPLIQRRLAGSRILSVLENIALACSDSGVLVVTPRAVIFPAVLAVAAVVYIGIGLNQSSLGVWEDMYPARPVDQLVDLGQPKHIRSDEWNTQSPWVLNQVLRSEPETNVGLGGEKSPLLTAVPIANLAGLVQIKFFGFHILDTGRGFSWWWAYKTFGLLFFAYWLLLILSRGSVAASFIGAVWLYGSSFTQWWLSSNLPEILIAFMIAVLGATYLLFGQRLRGMVLGGLIVPFASLNLLLHPYPPFIVPLAYLGAVILLGVAFERGGAFMLRSLKYRVAVASCSIMVTVWLAASYLTEAWPTIEAAASTSYPGQRISSSGGLPILKLLYGYFEGFRVGESHIPLLGGNASEAATFAIYFPLIFLALPLRSLFSRSGALLLLLALYCISVALWSSTNLPRFIETVMQAGGWSWVPPARAVVGFGVGSVFATTVLFGRMSDPALQSRSRRARLLLVVVGIICLTAFGGWAHHLDPGFFSQKVILAGCVAGALIIGGALLGRTGLFGLGIALLTAAPLMVNPLVSGLSAVLDKPILRTAAQGSVASDRWIVIGDFVFAQGLKAHGLEVLGGSQMIPNREMTSVLDPDANHEEIWNRYAHVKFSSDPYNEAPAFELQGPDLYVVAVDVCNVARDLGVTKIAYTGDVPEGDLRCLRGLHTPTDAGVKLFGVREGKW